MLVGGSGCCGVYEVITFHIDIGRGFMMVVVLFSEIRWSLLGDCLVCQFSEAKVKVLVKPAWFGVFGISCSVLLFVIETF